MHPALRAELFSLFHTYSICLEAGIDHLITHSTMCRLDKKKFFVVGAGLFTVSLGSGRCCLPACHVPCDSTARSSIQPRQLCGFDG